MLVSNMLVSNMLVSNMLVSNMLVSNMLVSIIFTGEEADSRGGVDATSRQPLR